MLKKILSICNHLKYQFESRKIDVAIGNLQDLIDKYNDDSDCTTNEERVSSDDNSIIMELTKELKKRVQQIKMLKLAA